jgi:hypothetical protein
MSARAAGDLTVAASGVLQLVLIFVNHTTLEQAHVQFWC